MIFQSSFLSLGHKLLPVCPPQTIPNPVPLTLIMVLKTSFSSLVHKLLRVPQAYPCSTLAWYGMTSLCWLFLVFTTILPSHCLGCNAFTAAEKKKDENTEVWETEMPLRKYLFRLLLVGVLHSRARKKLLLMNTMTIPPPPYPPPPFFLVKLTHIVLIKNTKDSL